MVSEEIRNVKNKLIILYLDNKKDVLRYARNWTDLTYHSFKGLGLLGRLSLEKRALLGHPGHMGMCYFFGIHFTVLSHPDTQRPMCHGPKGPSYALSWLQHLTLSM
jgi:hypothetical protein